MSLNILNTLVAQFEFIGFSLPYFFLQLSLIEISVSAIQRFVIDLSVIAIRFSVIAPTTLNIYIINTISFFFISFQTPVDANQWTAIADAFELPWQFPHCVGAVDGKHAEIKPPPGSGSYYYNYKGSHSIVLMAVANANYKFFYVDVGANGRISAGGVWGNFTLSKLLEANKAGLPAAKN